MSWCMLNHTGQGDIVVVRFSFMWCSTKLSNQFRLLHCITMMAWKCTHYHSSEFTIKMLVQDWILIFSWLLQIWFHEHKCILNFLIKYPEKMNMQCYSKLNYAQFSSVQLTIWICKNIQLKYPEQMNFCPAIQPHGLGLSCQLASKLDKQ